MKKENKIKKNLEETIKEKISPLLESVMEKNIGVSIPKIEENISDKLQKPHLEIYIPNNVNFSEAKKIFKKEFIKRELILNEGNISSVAKQLGLNRRSIHRAIKDLNIKVDKIRMEEKSKEDYQSDIIGEKIRSTLDEYKEIIQPQKMEKMYQQVSTLSKNIAKFVPMQKLSWKIAEKEFEKQFLTAILKKNNWKIIQTANIIEIRVETLYRKIKKLNLMKL